MAIKSEVSDVIHTVGGAIVGDRARNLECQVGGCTAAVRQTINFDSVIGSNVGGIPEILNNGDALYEMTEKSLYSKLEQLITNNEVLLRLAEQQKGRTDELTFNWAEQISCMLRI